MNFSLSMSKPGLPKEDINNTLYISEPIPPTQSTQSPSVHKPKVGERDEEEFPEGGRGWIVIFASWIIMGTSYGFINSFGEYQNHYSVIFPDTKQSVLTLIGSLQPFMIYSSGIPATILISRWGPRPVVALGGLTMIFAFMMMSICKEVWQLFLAQGVLFGAGCGLCGFVAFSLPQQWFKKKRALAVGICASGSSLGGMLWPIAFNSLITKVGLDWTNRIIGLIYIPLIAVAVFGAEARPTDEPLSIQQTSSDLADLPEDPENPEDNFGEICIESQIISPTREEKFENIIIPETPKKTLYRRIFRIKTYVEWSVLDDFHFLLFILSNSIAFYALFPPLFFLPSYARNMNASPNITKYILTIVNGGSIIGRILPGYIGDKIGRVNSLIPCLAFSGISTLAFWLPSRGDALLVLFAVTYGISSGAVVSLGPSSLGQLFGIKNLKSRLSLMFLTAAPGCLVGPSVSGVFLPSATGDGIEGYYKIVIFCSIIFFASAAVLLALRLSISRKLFAFV